MRKKKAHVELPLFENYLIVVSCYLTYIYMFATIVAAQLIKPRPIQTITTA